MGFVATLLLFLAVAAATWATAVAVYQASVGGPDVRQSPAFRRASARAVGLVALASFIPYPGGYVASLAVWWVAAKPLLGLPTPRAVTLFGLLAGLSFVTRLAVRGALAL